MIRLTDADLEPPVSLNAIVAALGGLAVLLILYRIISPPDFGSFGGVSVDATLKFGIFLGLIAAAGIAYGGYSAMREEGATFGDEADRLSGGGQPPAGGPLASAAIAATTSASTAAIPAATAAAPSTPNELSQDGLRPVGLGRREAVEGSALTCVTRRRPTEDNALRRYKPAGHFLRERDDGHHRVDADRGGEERGVGDVEAGDAVDRAVGGADTLGGVGGDPRRPLRDERPRGGARRA